MASAIVLATGAAVALRGGQPVAFWASVAISAVFVAGYERAIAKPAKAEEQGEVGPRLASLGMRFP